jgi:hypothetical protein
MFLICTRRSKNAAVAWCWHTKRRPNHNERTEFIMATWHSNADSACSFIRIPPRTPLAEIERANLVSELALGPRR